MYISQRMGILRLLQILQNETDENKPLSTNEILNRLNIEYGIQLERKTLYEYMDLLCDAGYDIVKNRGQSNTYFLGSREFELAELKILIDVVLASRFITKTQSKNLVDKLAGFAGKHKEQLLKRDIVLTDVKHNNNNVLYIVDTVFEAINNNKKVSFYYYDYIIGNQKSLHREERYIVDPIKLIYSNENYYLAACTDDGKTKKNFRVDKMDGVKEEQTSRTDCQTVKNFDLNTYMKQTFSMYGGRTETVQFCVHKDIVKSAIDRFGGSITFTCNDDDTLCFLANVKVSPTFFSWCSTFGKNLKILSPDNVRSEYSSFLSDAMPD